MWCLDYFVYFPLIESVYHQAGFHMSDLEGIEKLE